MKLSDKISANLEQYGEAYVRNALNTTDGFSQSVVPAVTEWLVGKQKQRAKRIIVIAWCLSISTVVIFGWIVK
jgi:hypothetical protein